MYYLQFCILGQKVETIPLSMGTLSILSRTFTLRSQQGFFSVETGMLSSYIFLTYKLEVLLKESDMLYSEISQESVPDV